MHTLLDARHLSAPPIVTEHRTGEFKNCIRLDAATLDRDNWIVDPRVMARECLERGTSEFVGKVKSDGRSYLQAVHYGDWYESADGMHMRLDMNGIIVLEKSDDAKMGEWAQLVGVNPNLLGIFTIETMDGRAFRARRISINGELRVVGERIA